MRKIGFILLAVIAAFTIESSLSYSFAGWIVPNLTLLATIFVTLSLGIRHGLFSALLGGIIKDSFLIGIFGTNILSLIICAYLTTILRKHVYIVSTQWFRVLLVSIICSVNLFITLILYSMSSAVDWKAFLVGIYLPQMAMTLLATSFTFDFLKKCASKLFV